ncbi:MAG TPA: nucleotide exchange factor GrpE, partial [Patescibacteria group bacterium]|nr:nucleotide exchange factor GrpE [Patescibacteria group bacterium]
MSVAQKQTDHSGKQPKHDQENQLAKEIEVLQEKLEAAELDHKRAIADYINLQRRTQENQERFVKLASATLIERLLEPLDHLEMTAVHMGDTTL